MEWNMNYVMVVVGLVAVIGLIGWLALQRLGILLKPGDKQAALKRSIDKSWLHQLGGGGATRPELWIMTLVAAAAAIYKAMTVRTFDFSALLDAFVAACLAFVLANVVRLIIKAFLRRQTVPAISQPPTEGKP